MTLWDLYGGSKGGCDTTFARLWFEVEIDLCLLDCCLFAGKWMRGNLFHCSRYGGGMTMHYSCKFLFPQQS
jgi:hypothetical protein